MPESNLDPELTALAGALASLSPALPALNRDQLFFEAGRRAARPRPRPWGWPLATGLCATVAVGLGLRLATAPEPVHGPQVVYVQVPVKPVTELSAPPASISTAFADHGPIHPAAEALRLRELRILWGENAPPRVSASMPANEPVELLLGLTPGSLTDAELRRVKMALSRGDI